MATLDDLGVLPARRSPTVAWAIACSLLLHGLLLAWLPPLAPALGAVRSTLPVMLQVRLRADVPVAPPAAARTPVAAAKTSVPARAAVPRIARAAVAPAAVEPAASSAPFPAGIASRPAPTSLPGGPAAAQEVAAVEPVVTPPDLRAAYLANPRPPYPLAARRLGLEGQVVLRAEILPDGRCGELVVAQSSGHALLDEAALAAVKRWRFLPARRGEAPIAAWVEIPIRFRLTDSSADPHG
ncbi:energy transducer TonB [Thiobacter aerophilum]|uniref:Energy transducer TonB n=1 Tax=Thiobacter aerophilum TaxID=3121275 RepID=A0ABV0EF17_9BURK